MPVSKISRRALIHRGAAAGLVTVFPAYAQSTAALSFLTVGDWGRRGMSNQTEVGRAMGLHARLVQSRFVMTVGDNFYNSGVRSPDDSHWRKSFENIYVDDALQTEWHPALGNHDHRGAPDAQVAYSGRSNRWRMRDRYYREIKSTSDGQTVDLFVLDTYPLVKEPAGSASWSQLVWLAEELATSTAHWKLVFGHHAIYSGGSLHGSSRTLIQNLQPILARHGVQAYVCGHDHDLQHIVGGKMHYICTGAGSATRSVKAIPGTQFRAAVSGFTAFSIRGDQLGVDFVDQLGCVRHTAVVSRTWQGLLAAEPGKCDTAATPSAA